MILFLDLANSFLFYLLFFKNWPFLKLIMAKLVLFHFFRTWQPLLDVHLAVDAPLPLPPLARLLQLKERACATMGLRVLLTANAYKLTHNCWGTIQ